MNDLLKEMTAMLKDLDRRVQVVETATNWRSYTKGLSLKQKDDLDRANHKSDLLWEEMRES